MRVAVTGGTGFIGKKLVAELIRRGDSVRLLTRNGSIAFETGSDVEVCECDLITVNIDKLSSMLDGVDVIYHCAGQLKDTNTMWELHVRATRKLAEAASRRINHWVQLSSVGVYGATARGTTTETSVLRPVGKYEITKAESDQIIVDAGTEGWFSSSILRPSNVFGPDMTNQSLFSMLAMIDRGLFFHIGKPGASANFVHIDNVVDGLIRCGTMQAAKGKVYNLSDHRTLEQFVEVIAVALGRPSPALRIPESLAYLMGMTLGRLPSFPLTRTRVKALVNRSVYPISRIQDELGYRHVISMEDGLRELVKEYRQRLLHCEPE